MHFLISLGFLVINCYIQPHLSFSSVTSLQKDLIEDDVLIKKNVVTFSVKNGEGGQ